MGRARRGTLSAKVLRLLLNELDDGVAKLGAHGLAAHVARAHVRILEQLLDGPDDGVGGILVTEVLEHHGP